MTLRNDKIDIELIEALLETEVGFGGILPRNSAAQEQIDALIEKGYAIQNVKGSYNATSKLREENPWIAQGQINDNSQ